MCVVHLYFWIINYKIHNLLQSAILPITIHSVLPNFSLCSHSHLNLVHKAGNFVTPSVTHVVYPGGLSWNFACSLENRNTL
jgi:hypothetical protein